MRIEMVNPGQVMLDEIAAGATRKSVAGTYAFALRDAFKTTDWGTINAAIIERWSLSGLQYIKERAWAYMEGRKEFGT